jgi:hypothetical protein
VTSATAAKPVDQAEPVKAPSVSAPPAQDADLAKRTPAAETTTAKTTTAKTTAARTTTAKATAAKATARATPAKSATKATKTKAAPPKITNPAKAATKAPAKTTAAKTTAAKAPAKTTATKTTAAKATGTPAKAAPRVEVPVAEPAPIAGRPDTLWDRLRAEPGQARELLARAAVERYGPEADTYTRWVRATYPGAGDDRIAHAAARRFTAQARRGVLAGIVAREAGEASALAWLQARMVLHIAAAYRHDPTAAERAGELLTLMAPPRVPAQVAAAAVGRRLATRLVPGAGLLLGAFVNDAATGALARRAMSLYRPVPRLP